MATRKSYLDSPTSRYFYHPTDTQFDFDEFDISWNPTVDSTFVSEGAKSSSAATKKPSRASCRKGNNSTAARSLPMDIPDWRKILRREPERGIRVEEEEEEDNVGEEDVSRLAPHEYLARTRVASLSVHEGVGRTLKGRDLSRVRDAIWKQTGLI